MEGLDNRNPQQCFRTSKQSKQSPRKIGGICHYAMAANNRVYIAGYHDFEIPDSMVCEIGNKVDGLSPGLLEEYRKPSWEENTDKNTGIPKGLEVMKSFLKSHVQVFARKDYPTAKSNR